MSQPYSESQLARFKQALANKEITPEQYNQQMAFQSQRLAEAKARQAQQPAVQPKKIHAKINDLSTIAINNPDLFKQIPSGATITEAKASKEGDMINTKVSYTMPQPAQAPVQEQPQPKPEPFSLNRLFDPLGHNSPKVIIGAKEFRDNPLNYTISESVKVGSALAFIVSPPTALIGAVTAPVISQGFRFIPSNPITGSYQGTWLTPEEIGESAQGGALFSVAGAGMLKGIGLAGRTLGLGLPSGLKGVAVSVAGRAAVNAGMGGTTSYVLSGGDPVSGVKGAAFGAAFSLGSDALMLGVPKITGRIQGKLQDRFATSKMSENLSNYYEVITKDNLTADIYDQTVTGRYKPNFSERLAMRITGLRPMKPALGVDALPNISTSGQWTNEAIKVNGVPRNVPVDVDVVNMGVTKKGALLGFNKAKGTEFLAKDTMLNTEVRMNAGLDWDVNQAAYGRSFDPVAYSKNVAKVSQVTSPKSLPLFLGLSSELIKLDAVPLKGMMNEKNIPESVLEKEYQGKTVKTGSLAFDKTPYKMKVDSEGAFVRENLPTLKNLIPKEYVAPSGPMKPLWDSVGSKAPTEITFPSSPIKQSTILQKRANIINGAIPQRSLAGASQVLKSANPFLRFVGTSYYAQSSLQVEDYELDSFTMPGQVVRLTPKLALGAVQVPIQTQQRKQNQIQRLKISTPTLQAQIPIQKQKQNQKNILGTMQIPVQIQKQMQQQKQQQKQMTSNIPFNKQFFAKSFPKIPALSLGGGFDTLGPKRSGYSQWFQKKHKIKTYSQMLNTFGVGKAGKPMRQIEKSTNKLVKAFKHKQPRRTNRKR